MDIRNVADSIRNNPAEVVNRLRDRLPEDLAERLDMPVPEALEPRARMICYLSLRMLLRKRGALPGVEVLNVVRDPGDARQSAPVLIDVAKDLVEEGREVQNRLEPLRKLDRALQLLRSIRITEDTRQLDNVAQRLIDLNAETDRIAAEIGDRRSPDAG